MMPAVPPLPTPWNLPFHVVIGSHTSYRTDGFVTATTRQNAGRLFSAGVPGGVKDGPVTSAADSIAVSVNTRFFSAAHCAAATLTAACARTGTAGTATIMTAAE